VLELLYGAVPRRLSDGTDAPGLTGTFWDDAIGLCGWQYGGSYNPSYWITQLDGLTHMRGGTQAGLTNWDSFAIEQGNENTYVFGQFNDYVYSFDKHVGAIIELVAGTGVVNEFSGCDLRCPDRWLYALRDNAGNLRVYYKPLDGAVDGTQEAIITGIPAQSGASGLCTWSKTNIVDEFYIITDGGSAIIYNTTTKTFYPETLAYLPKNRKAWYSPRFDVFVVLFNINTMSVYASSPEPYSLSNPVAVPSLTRGRVCTVRTQLLGDMDEPCPDELVNWSLTAGSGELLTLQSTTDSDGYADAQYLAPMTGGTDPTIEAQVRF
jgi:hypothetical protein